MLKMRLPYRAATAGGSFARNAGPVLVFILLLIPPAFAADPLPQGLVGGAFQISSSQFDETNADIAYDSDNNRYMVVWQLPVSGGTAIGAAILNANGTFLGAGPFFVRFDAPPNLAGIVRRPAVAFAPGFGYYVVFEENFGAQTDIMGVPVSSAGAVSIQNYLNLSRGNAAEQSYPDIAATGGSGFLVVWQDFRTGNNEIVAQSVVAGNFGSVVNYALTADARSDERPAIASAFPGVANRNVVVWQRFNGVDHDVIARVFDNTGNVVSVELPIGVFAYSQIAPAIAYDSQRNEFMVVWETSLGGTASDITGCRLQYNFNTNLFLAPTFPISTIYLADLEPSVAVDPATGRFLVVWERDMGTIPSSWNIIGQFINTNGTLAGLPETIAGNANTRQLLPAVAFSSTANQFLTVWHDDRASQFDVWGQLVNFTAPTLTVTSPNGGEVWAPNSTHNVTWTSTNAGTTVTIDLLLNGTPTLNIATNASNNGSFGWTIPVSVAEGNTYTVRVTAASASDVSNAFFTISAGGATLQITSPNGGEQWQTGTPHTITWQTGNTSVTPNVQLLLLENGAETVVIANSTPNDGSQPWTVTQGLTPGAFYRVRIRSTTNAANTDDSDANFTITNVSPVTITVTAPNGGEPITLGSVFDITWSTSGAALANVRIELYQQAGALVQLIEASTPNDGSQSWSVSTGLTPASNYVIRISDPSNPSNFDESNAAFTLQAGSTTELRVVAPNGGEIWPRGTTHNIQWSAVGITGSIRIDLLKGAAVTPIASGIAASQGSFSWPISASITPGSDYTVRVATSDLRSDTSNAPFSIVGNDPLRVTSPNGGEVWHFGETHNITWAPDSSVSARVFLTKNNITVASIADPTPNDGITTWTIPETLTAGTDYRVRVISANNPLSYDSSDAAFTINAPADLRIESFGFSPQVLNNGDPVHFTGRVINGGDAAAANFWVEFRVSRSIDFSEPTAYLCDSFMCSNLAPGASIDLSTLNRTVYPIGQLPQGAYIVGVRVDPQGAVAESNERNNQAWVSPERLYVGPRPAAVRRWNLFR
jgi:hypothetical protein